MKKVLFFAALLLFVTNTFAQLVVDNTGNVGIGTENPNNLLSINRVTTSSTPISALRTYSKGSSWSSRNVGIESRVVGVASGYSCALMGVTDSTYACAAMGVFGSSVPYGSSSAGIYGSTYYYANADSSFFFAPYYGKYAGFFRGNTRITGSALSSAYLSASGNSASSMSDFQYLSEIDNIPTTEKLQQLEAIQFKREDPAMTAGEAESISDKENTLELSSTQYGLEIEQLKNVYPELVYEDQHGNISVNYVEMIPILIQSIKELSAEVKSLKQGESKRVKQVNTAIESTNDDTDIVRMSQNSPNPFSESSVITLNIPKSAKSAAIYVYDLSGKQVSNVPVQERGETNVTMYASQLSAGMFIYSLVVDGKVCVTRRMMVSM